LGATFFREGVDEVVIFLGLADGRPRRAGRAGAAAGPTPNGVADRTRIWNAHFSGHGRSLILRRQWSQPENDDLTASIDFHEEATESWRDRIIY
jgi:hypothetical protein